MENYNFAEFYEYDGHMWAMVGFGYKEDNTPTINMERSSQNKKITYTCDMVFEEFLKYFISPS